MGEIATPADLAKAWGCSERHIRQLARRIGACHVAGKVMWLDEKDKQAVWEAMRPCPLKSTDAKDQISGTTEARLPEGSYVEALKLATRIQHSGSRPKSKRGTGKVVSMVPNRS